MTSALRLWCVLTLLHAQGALAQNAPISLSPPGQKPPVAANAPAAAASREELVSRVNSYFNGLSGFVSEFIQHAADGRRLDGKLYVQRPGKLRFDYNPPSEIEIIADGKSVVVRNRKLATQDIYPIGQTPLKFLLAETIDITRDLKLVRVSKSADTINVVLEDKSTLGGTSRVNIAIDDAKSTLKQWIVTDPQGFDTRIVISNMNSGRRIDPGLFKIDYTRAIESLR